MQDFVHLHVHSQYSILDGQASIQKLVDKAIDDGMRGIAITDHGNMFGIKEFWNYVKKKNGARRDKVKQASAAVAELQAVVDAGDATEEQLTELARLKAEYDSLPKEDFKAIIGCEVYVARRGLQFKEGKQDQSGWHLILLAKNKTGYKNLIKIVSKAWTDCFYMRPRTDHAELEKYHEGLICCSACLGGEIPKKIEAGDLAAAEEAVRWHKELFGEDYYLELQLHKATVEHANHEFYPQQKVVNKHLIELSQKLGVKLVCTNDVHFVDEVHAEAHDRLICLSTSKDLDDPKRMLYSKQEWMKTRAEMNAIFEDVPEALSNTVEICNKVESYSIDHAPIMPTFEIPEEFGTEEGYRARLTEKDL
ncbi:MAG: PHP domain-containing protein, partial [Rikenellaceae bacterium]|nr:PHP domain-containing protein [Rikenellaceae bacterium]